MSSIASYLVCDLHINESSSEIVKKAIQDIFQDMQKDNVKTLIFAGDIFDFRKSQTLTTIDCFDEILEEATNLGIKIIAIPGNHDKMSYSSERSYLDVYRHHPSLSLYRTTTLIEVEGLPIYLIPYFREEDIYPKYLSLIDKSQLKSNTILVTHMAVEGVRNNDGSEVQSNLKVETFSKFKNVFIGHYHDRQFIGDNIIYAGSLMQRNFGETPNKGYTKIFTNGEYEFVDKEYQVYETVKLNYSETLTSDLEKLSKVQTSDVLKVRVILNGTKEELDSLKSLPILKQLDSSGIVLKNNYQSIEEVKIEEAEEFTPFTVVSVLEEWEEFADLNKLSKETGKIILKKYLNV